MKKVSLFVRLLAVAACLSNTGCLKDDSQPDFTQNKAVVELPIGSSAGNGGGNSIAAAFTVSDTPSDYLVWVNYAAPDANDKDVVVTLAIDTAVLGKFNRINGKNYILIPPAGITIPSASITIPKGQRKVQFPVKINTNVLDPTKTYGLPLAITDASGYTISGNFGTLVTVISLKNKWDGVYEVTGTMVDHTNSSLTGLYPRTLQLVTQGPTSVAIYDPGQNVFGHGISNSGSTTVYGSFTPVFTINPVDNKVTAAVNYYGQPSADNSRACRLDASGDNVFTMSEDGSTPVSLKVKYVMTQSGSDRTFFDETWTYKSSR